MRRSQRQNVGLSSKSRKSGSSRKNWMPVSRNRLMQTNMHKNRMPLRNSSNAKGKRMPDSMRSRRKQKLGRQRRIHRNMLQSKRQKQSSPRVMQKLMPPR